MGQPGVLGRQFAGQLNAPNVHLWPIVYLSAGGDHTCVTDWNHQVWCWGDNSRGQSTPPVGSMGGLSVAAGHACGVTLPDYKVACWGDDWGTAIALPPNGQFNNMIIGDDLNCAYYFDGSGQPPICWGSTYQPWY
jgi:Regulator of chromosome condensation (RCC1) repeat